MRLNSSVVSSSPYPCYAVIFGSGGHARFKNVAVVKRTNFLYNKTTVRVGGAVMSVKSKNQGFLHCEEVEPDEWDLRMLARCADGQESDYISFDECLAELGLTYDDLQI